MTATREKSPAAKGAADIKKRLRKDFPGVKFSVRSDIFAGGDSIDVRWSCGPTTRQVEEISNAYQDGSFDGMIDLYTYDNSEEQRAHSAEHGGAKFVQTQRDYKPAGKGWQGELEFFERVGLDLCDLQHVEYVGLDQRNVVGSFDRFNLQDHVYRILARTTFEPGKDYGGLERTPEDEQETGHDWCRVRQVEKGTGFAL